MEKGDRRLQVLGRVCTETRTGRLWTRVKVTDDYGQLTEAV